MGIKVEITKELQKEINKKFKKESIKIMEYFYSLKETPLKGKTLTQIEGIVLKELKYKSFRFYFICDGEKLKLITIGEVTDIIFKFIKMSKKNDQDKVIGEIKDLLRKLGFDEK